MCSLVVLMIVGGLSCFESAMPATHTRNRPYTERTRSRLRLAALHAHRLNREPLGVSRASARCGRPRPGQPSARRARAARCATLRPLALRSVQHAPGLPAWSALRVQPGFHARCVFCLRAAVAASGAKACCVLRSGWVVPRRDERILRVGPPPCTPCPPTLDVLSTLHSLPRCPPLRPIHH